MMLLDLIDLPFPITLKTFLNLDGSSLHICRQVCKNWNTFILKEIWKSRWGKKLLREKLESQWRNGEYKVSVTNFQVDCKLGMSEVLLCLSENTCVVRLGDSGLSVLVMERESLEWKAVIEGESRLAEKGDFFRKV